MQTKLTLRLDDALIASAKNHARASGRSLSQLVADYFALLQTSTPEEPQTLGPNVRALRGALRPSDGQDSEVDRKDYRRYLEAKHLGVPSDPETR